MTQSGLPNSCRAGQPWLTNESHAGDMDWGGGQVSGEHLIDIDTCRVMTKAWGQLAGHTVDGRNGKVVPAQLSSLCRWLWGDIMRYSTGLRHVQPRETPMG